MRQSSFFTPRSASRGRRLRLALVAAAAVAAPVVGCQAYVPVAGAPVPDGARVRVELTDAGSAALGSYLGADVLSVTGRLVASDDSLVNVAMISTQLTGGRERYWSGERVAVPRRYVATVRRQRFSGTRTALLSAGLGGIAFAISQGLGGIAGGNSSPTHSGTGGPK